MALKFVCANSLGSRAQAVVATVEDENGDALKQFTQLAPFAETGMARDAAIRKANDWLKLTPCERFERVAALPQYIGDLCADLDARCAQRHAYCSLAVHYLLSHAGVIAEYQRVNTILELS